MATISEPDKLDARTAVEKVLAEDGASARFAFVGQVSAPNPPPAERLLVCPVVPGREPSFVDLQEFWLLTPELPAFVAGLAARVGARLGGSDAMFAVGGARCWAPALGPKDALAAQTPLERWPDPKTAAPFVCFDEGRLTCHASPEGLFVAGSAPIPATEIERIVYSISDDWCDREVSAVLRDGRSVRIAFDQTTTPLLGSMVYDGFDLLMDSGWGREVARALGNVLGRPVVQPP